MKKMMTDETRDADPASNANGGRLGELALTFLRLGATAFGGPAAHIALMEDEVVRRKGWIAREEFLDLLGMANLIPGPNSTEMAMHVGWRRAGFAGLLVAGGCFILPAAMIVTLLAWAYVRFGSLPTAAGLLYGVKPVVMAIVAQALWRLGRTALKTSGLAAVGLAGVALSLAGVGEVLVLLASGVVTALAGRRMRRDSVVAILSGVFVSAPLAGAAPAAAMASGGAPFGLGALFLFFLKVGSILFGSGYVLLAFLQADLVERWRWLTEAQLLDAIAIGQMTPGPVLTAATFIGYLLGGVLGAGVATVGVFLPAFVFVALSGPILPRLRRSPAAGKFLDGVNVASFALMAVATTRLALAAIIDLETAAIAGASAGLLMRFRLNSGWLILGGALLGLLIASVR